MLHFTPRRGCRRHRALHAAPLALAHEAVLKEKRAAARIHRLLVVHIANGERLASVDLPASRKRDGAALSDAAYLYDAIRRAPIIEGRLSERGEERESQSDRPTESETAHAHAK